MKAYRVAGCSMRFIEGENPHLCCVVELQHKESGDLYHYHRDFARTTRGAFLCGIDLSRFLSGRTPHGWELR